MNEISSYLNNLNNLAGSFDDALVQKRSSFVVRTVNELQNGQIPTSKFFSLVFTEAEIIEILQNCKTGDFEENIQKLEELDSILSYFRQFLQENFGYWATITQPFMNSFIKEFEFESSLELMAGNGYVSSFLQNAGKNAIATDSNSWSESSKTGQLAITNIVKMDALDAFNKYSNQVDVIILAWSPDFDEIDYQILAEYRKIEGPKPLFFVIGEKNGATNSKKFWNNVDLVTNSHLEIVNKEYVQYDIVKDRLYIVK